MTNLTIGDSIQWCLFPDKENLYQQQWKTDVITGENGHLYYTKLGKRFGKVDLKMVGTGYQVLSGRDKFDLWEVEYKIHHIKSQSLNTLKDCFGIMCSGYTKNYGTVECKKVVEMLQGMGYEFGYVEVLE